METGDKLRVYVGTGTGNFKSKAEGEGEESCGGTLKSGSAGLLTVLDDLERIAQTRAETRVRMSLARLAYLAAP